LGFLLNNAAGQSPRGLLTNKSHIGKFHADPMHHATAGSLFAARKPNFGAPSREAFPGFIFQRSRRNYRQPHQLSQSISRPAQEHDDPRNVSFCQQRK